MRVLRWAVLLAGIAVGLWLIGSPYYNEVVYTHEAETVICAFREQVEAEREAVSEEAAPSATIYPELLRAMQDYNRTLAEDGQACLTGPADYERPPVSLSDYDLEEDAPVGVLSIPSIELELPLYLGANTSQMAKGAAVLGGTSCPIGGTSTNCVIAGHRGYRGIPYFRYLDRLEPSDIIYLTNLWETLTYEVTGSQVIAPNDLNAILIEDGADKLTLLTCHPYTVGTQRLVVYCQRKY